MYGFLMSAASCMLRLSTCYIEWKLGDILMCTRLPVSLML